MDLAELIKHPELLDKETLYDLRERGGRLVEDQHRRVLQEDSCDGDPLLLTTGEQDTSLADIGLITLRHRCDVVRDLRLRSRKHHLFHRRIEATVADIVGNASSEQEHVLRNDADVLVQGLLRHHADIVPVEVDRAVRNIVETRNQLAERRLAAAGGTDEGHRLTRTDVERHVVQDALPLLVREGHVVDADVALHVLQRKRARAVLELRLGPHQLHEAMQSRRAVRDHLRGIRELSDRIHEGRHIHAERDQVNDGELVVHDEGTTDRDDHHGHHAEAELHRRMKFRHRAVEPELRAPVACIGLLKLLELLPLVREGLRRPDAGQTRLEFGVDQGNRRLHLARGVAHVETATQHHRQEDRQHERQHECEPPLDGEHDDERAEDRHRADEDVLRGVVRHLRHVEQVRREAAHELADAVMVEEAVVQLLDVPEQVAADVGLDACAEVVAPVRDHVVKHGTQHVGGGHDGHHRPEGAPGVRREQRVHAPARHRRKGEIDHRDRQRAHHVEVKQLPVRAEIREKNPKFRGFLQG